MSGVRKIIDKMKKQPNGIRFEEAEKVLNHIGYKMGNRKSKSSHRVFRNDEGKHLSVPYKNPIDKVYVKEILQRIEDLSL